MPIDTKQDKRSILTDVALRLFYQQGIHAVGINEILATSGIAKKTLYNHFNSKEELIQACIIERDKRFMQWLTIACSNKGSTEAFIEHMFDALNHWINNRVEKLDNFKGCFFINTAAEYGEEHSKIYNLCLQHKVNVKQFISQQLAKDINDDTQLSQLTDLILQLKEGSINCAYVMGDKNAALKSKALAIAFNNH